MKIIFFFPYKILSGVPILFSNMANYLSKKHEDIHVSIIDYEDGALWKCSTEKRIKKIPFTQGKSITPDPNSILVLQATLPFAMRPELKLLPDQKLFFWHLHPNNLTLNNIFKKDSLDFFLNKTRIYQKNNVKEFISILDENNSIVYMDGANYNNTSQYYKINPTERFLPILINESENNQDCSTVAPKNNKLVFSYIGRISDFKYYPLLKLLKSINENVIPGNISNKLEFIIIGDGDLRKKLETETSKMKFTIKYLGEVKNHQVAQVLLSNNINVNFAMGTSALDSCRLGIPTVVLNYSYSNIEGYPIYNWIFDEEKYSLGHELKADELENNSNSLVDIIREYQNNQEEIANKTSNYFINNFYHENVLSNFLLYIKKSTLTYSKIKKYTRKNLIRKYYNKRKYGIS